jgi:hypothetical protein
LNQLRPFPVLDAGIEPGLNRHFHNGSLASGSARVASRQIDGPTMDRREDQRGRRGRSLIQAPGSFNHRLLHEVLRVRI